MKNSGSVNYKCPDRACTGQVGSIPHTLAEDRKNGRKTMVQKTD